MKNPRLILASNSPRRRALLRQIGLKFIVQPSSVDESFNRRYSPAVNARRIALRKALDVARRYNHGLVLGADTVVVLGRRVLGKPRTFGEAKRMLRLLSGEEHTVYTGFAIVDSATGKRITGVEKTKVRFRKLTQEEIEAYVASGSPMDKAGAYGIQDDYGAVFIDRIEGCFYNVVGFPLARFYITLNNFLHELKRT